jgi:hypothetical protein
VGMENKMIEEPHFPLSLAPEEERKYIKDGVRISIKTNKESLNLSNACLVLTNQRVIMFTTSPNKLVLFFKYQNAITHGIDKQ